MSKKNWRRSLAVNTIGPAGRPVQPFRFQRLPGADGSAFPGNGCGRHGARRSGARVGEEQPLSCGRGAAIG
eukprot:3126589-Prymnesium_polylepis.1